MWWKRELEPRFGDAEDGTAMRGCLYARRLARMQRLSVVACLGLAVAGHAAGEPHQLAPASRPVSGAGGNAGPAGVALEASGRWQVGIDGQTYDLEQGDGIPNGGMLRRLSPDGSITVVLTDGTRFKCPGCDLCAKPIVVREAPSPTHSWWSAAVSMLARRHDQWIVPASRATGITPLNDAVISQRPGGIDLAPAFSGLPDGVYYAQLASVSGRKGEPPAALTGGVKVEHYAGQPLPLQSDAVRPGLYLLAVSERPDELPELQALILLTDPADYQAKSEAFGRAQAEAKALAQEVGEGSTRALLRAYLVWLSAESN